MDETLLTDHEHDPELPAPHRPSPAPAPVQTSESVTYPDVHTSVAPPGITYYLPVPGSWRRGSTVLVELRGWLRDISEGPNTSEFPDPVDFSYGLELDPRWCDRLGVNLNTIVRVGGVISTYAHLLEESSPDHHVPPTWPELEKAAFAPPHVKIEIMSWRDGQTIGRWSDRVTGRRDVPRPTGWNHIEMIDAIIVVGGGARDDLGDDDSDQGGQAVAQIPTFWPFDPRTASAAPTGFTDRPLKAGSGSDGDYVRIIGALVTDFPHGLDVLPWADPYRGTYGGTQLNSGNPTRWTEIHPPDSIEVLPLTPQRETVQCVAVCAAVGETRQLDFSIIPPPCRATRSQLVCTEQVDREVSDLATIVVGNNGGFPTLGHNTGARITIEQDRQRVHIEVAVRGVQLDDAELFGAFRATYRVRWHSPVTAQLAALFARESVELARLGGYTNAARNSLDPRLHHDWAAAQADARIVVNDLLDKFRLQLRRQLGVGHDEAARFFADTAVRFADYGRPFTPRRDPYWTDPATWNWNTHLAWALSLLDNANLATTGLALEALTSELTNRCEELCDGALSDQLLSMLYASESVFLAHLDGYGDGKTGRDDPDPHNHFRWSENASNTQLPMHELADKFTAQFDRLATQPFGFLGEAALYVIAASRLAAYGVNLGTAEANSLNDNEHADWVNTHGLTEAKQAITNRVVTLMTTLHSA